MLLPLPQAVCRCGPTGATGCTRIPGHRTRCRRL